MRKREILQLYKHAPAADIPNGAKLLLICVNRTIEDESLKLYDKVRYSWKLSVERADRRLVLAVAFGVIVGVFEVDEWLRATKDNFHDEIPEHHANWGHQAGRFGFRGREASDDVSSLYLYKRVPDELRNHGAAFRYVGA